MQRGFPDWERRGLNSPWRKMDLDCRAMQTSARRRTIVFATVAVGGGIDRPARTRTAPSNSRPVLVDPRSAHRKSLETSALAMRLFRETSTAMAGQTSWRSTARSSSGSRLPHGRRK